MREVDAGHGFAGRQFRFGLVPLDAPAAPVGYFKFGESGQPFLSDCAASFAHISLTPGKRSSLSSNATRAASKVKRGPEVIGDVLWDVLWGVIAEVMVGLVMRRPPELAWGCSRRALRGRVRRRLNWLALWLAWILSNLRASQIPAAA